MMLVEETLVPDEALTVDALKTHLRLGTGFDESDLQDSMLLSFLRAAIAAIEARTSKALISRSFLLTVDAWTGIGRQRLPIAPVQAVTEVSIVDAYGVASVVDPANYRLRQDMFTPELRALTAALPSIPGNGAAEIRFDAGYGASLESVPEDLKQAVALLAAHYYEFRAETALSQGCMPFGVTSLIARYRPIRLGAGA